MKNLMKMFGLMLMAALFSLMMLTGCEKDETTLSGNPDLELIPASQLMGAYVVSDACYEVGMSDYIIRMNPISGKKDGLVIYNFMNRGIIVTAYQEEGRFNIPLQTFTASPDGARSDAETYTIRGELFYNSGRELFMTYEFVAGRVKRNCYANCNPTDK